MELPIFIKIKLIAIVLLSMVAFAWTGTMVTVVDDISGVLTITRHSNPMMIYCILLILAAVVTSFAKIIAGKHARELLPLALPAGLCAWSFASCNFDNLLIDISTIAERKSLFYNMLTEVFLLYIPVGIICLILFIKTKTGNHEVRAVKLVNESDSANKKGGIVHDPRFSVLLSVVFSSVLAYVLLGLTTRSGQALQFVNISASVPTRLGQGFFAVMASFTLSTMASHQIFGGTVWRHITTPLIVSIIVYLHAAIATGDSIISIGTNFIPASTLPSSILPVQYVGAGVIAVIWGYWLSVQLILAREMAISAQE